MLERLKKTEAQIKELKRIIQREEWYGAELSLNIFVSGKYEYIEGESNHHHNYIEDASISNPDIIFSILENMLEGLEDSFKIQKIFLRDHVKEIMCSGFYEEEENAN
jgi:hypothetical protein